MPAVAARVHAIQRRRPGVLAEGGNVFDFDAKEYCQMPGVFMTCTAVWGEWVSD